jgi:hypothetical protein
MNALPNIYNSPGETEHVYSKLTYETHVNALKCSYAVRTSKKGINLVNLVYYNPRRKRVNECIESIIVYVDNVQHACVQYDIETALTNMCVLLGKRRICQRGCLLYIPLAMSPFHECNLIFCKNITIEINLRCNDIEMSGIYGNQVTYTNTSVTTFDSWYEKLILSVQHMFPNQNNVSNQKLQFEQPLHAILCWGFDKTQVQNIAVIINNKDYYNGPLDGLDVYNESLGYGDITASMILSTPYLFRAGALIPMRSVIQLRIATNEESYVLHVQGICQKQYSHKMIDM